MKVEVTPAGFELVLRHLKALKYFGLLENSTRFGVLYGDNANIWAILRREKIILSTVFTDRWELEGLGLYLQAFHGLENLYVLSPLTSLLGLQIVSLRHSISLAGFDINMTHSWTWPFDEASISAFPTLKSLVSHFVLNFHMSMVLPRKKL